MCQFLALGVKGQGTAAFQLEINCGVYICIIRAYLLFYESVQFRVVVSGGCSALTRSPFSTRCTVSLSTRARCSLVITRRTSSSEHLSTCLHFFSRRSSIDAHLPRSSSSSTSHRAVLHHYHLEGRIIQNRLASGI